MRGLLQKLNKRILLLNGATGTNLLDKGLAPGESPSFLNIRNPQAVFDIQKEYAMAGSDILLTNTFSANPLSIPSRTFKKVITAGVKIAKHAARGKAVVFGDIGPLGELIKPYGKLHFQQAFRNFDKIAKTMFDAGVRVYFLETFTSMIEAKAAFLATRVFSSHIFVCFSLQDNGKTIMGETPESIAVTFEALGARGIGVNCALPDVACDAIAQMAKITRLPLIIKPNAGRIRITGTRIHHTLSDSDMACYYGRFVDAGATIIGGCCGTSPAYVRMISRKKKTPRQRKVPKRFMLASPSAVITADTASTLIVGERLNPAGSKRVRMRLLKRDYSVYGDEARAQEQAGAHALDVNAFHADFDEPTSLENALHAVINNSRLPVFIDTQDYDAAENALSFYPGVGVYNSIPAQIRALRRWLPMVKRYGFKAVISLVGTRIPRTAKERMKNVDRALTIAREVGFPRDDLIFDPLVFSASTEREQIDHTLATVAQLAQRNLKTVLGISNVSFGLPDRSHMNATLATSAIRNGVTFLIVNPLDAIVMQAISSGHALFQRGTLRGFPDVRRAAVKPAVKEDLVSAIIDGHDRMSVECAQVLLDAGVPAQDIIDKHIAKALKKVGDNYERGKFFIPDLLKAAEASQRVLGVVQKYLPKARRKGKVIFATVKGDIHDIGKNIAAMIFESAGYEVIDLGKDVPCKDIVAAVRRHKPKALGLSALLTTTMPEMGRVIAQLSRERLRTKVIIGGPNVTPSYAKRIGAFGAARTVLEGLKLMKKK